MTLRTRGSFVEEAFEEALRDLVLAADLDEDEEWDDDELDEEDWEEDDDGDWDDDEEDDDDWDDDDEEDEDEDDEDWGDEGDADEFEIQGEYRLDWN